MNGRAGLGMSVVTVLGFGLVGLALAGCQKEKPAAPVKVTPAKAPQAAAAPAQPAVQVAEQTTCPVMGGAIDKNIFVEYKGKKVYFCCKGCVAQFQKDPEKYVSKLPQFAQ